MAIPLAGQRGARAVILDLDHAVIDSTAAWAYTIDEAVALTTGRRVDCRPLASAYQWRPWRDALRVVLSPGEDLDRCESLCRTMFARSAMKRLTVFDGVGMGLDRLRVARVEIGGITRHPHGLARLQIESTGVDRFLTVLAANPGGEPWDAPARVIECLRFLDCPPQRAAFLAADGFDLAAVAGLGVRTFAAGWIPGGGKGGVAGPTVAAPSVLQQTVAAAWPRP